MTDLIQSFCLVALTFVMAYQAFWGSKARHRAFFWT